MSRVVTVWGQISIQVMNDDEAESLGGVGGIKIVRRGRGYISVRYSI